MAVKALHAVRHFFAEAAAQRLDPEVGRLEDVGVRRDDDLVHAGSLSAWGVAVTAIICRIGIPVKKTKSAFHRGH
jgi:hypothetical protein